MLDVLALWLPLTTATVPPTKAWAVFCHEQPAECMVDETEPQRFVITDANWNRMVAINLQVNREFVGAPEPKDVWTFPVKGQTADCEDFVIEKRRRLIAAGFPRRALRVAAVITRSNEGHAVLVARTDRGDFVLDNQAQPIRLWSDAPYTWNFIEGDTLPLRWYSVAKRVNHVDRSG